MTNEKLREIMIKEFGTIANFFKFIGAKNPHNAAYAFKKTKRRNNAIEFIVKNLEKLKGQLNA